MMHFCKLCGTPFTDSPDSSPRNALDMAERGWDPVLISLELNDALDEIATVEWICRTCGEVRASGWCIWMDLGTPEEREELSRLLVRKGEPQNAGT